jgi:hypothetical protein
MDHIWQITRHLIKSNPELVQKTALRDCHCLGLNSFVINERPRIRLFVAGRNCELFAPFDSGNPIIPIHPHKYDDCFFTLRGQLVHHLYTVSQPGCGTTFNSYRHHRIGDNKVDLQNLGQINLTYLGREADIEVLMSRTLHTVSIAELGSMWVIVETNEDPGFRQIAYHQNLIQRPELYQQFENPLEYLKNQGL